MAPIGWVDPEPVVAPGLDGWTVVFNFKSYNLLRCTVVCLFARRYLKFCNFAFATNLCNLPPQGTAVCLFATGAPLHCLDQQNIAQILRSVQHHRLDQEAALTFQGLDGSGASHLQSGQTLWNFKERLLALCYNTRVETSSPIKRNKTL